VDGLAIVVEGGGSAMTDGTVCLVRYVTSQVM